MENTNKTIGFSIIQISTEQFAMIPEAFKVAEPSQIQHELSFGINKQESRVYVRKSARYHHLDNLNPFIIIDVSCQFLIPPEGWEKVKQVESDTAILPRDFGIHLAMLVVGTLRGVLHTKTENTIFNQFVFPPVDLTVLVPSDVIFE